MSWLDRLIAWMVKRDRCGGRQVITFEGVRVFWRYEPFWFDEWNGRNRPPWYRPFNILLHRWEHGEDRAFHDHPRWSVTVCLKGRLIEHTPWDSRVLSPGSMVFRSRKAIHAFEMLPDSGEVWTLFIVGRRNHRQNGYVVKPFGAE